MAGLTLYGMPISGYVRRQLAVLSEMGVEDFNLVSVNSVNGESHQPEHLARQPFGKIPVLEDNGELLYESRAIMRYIADKFSHQGPNLLGKDAMERGRVNQWIEVEAHTFSPEVITIVAELVYKPFFFKVPADEAKVEKAKEKLSSILAVYDRHLEGRSYLVGESFTLADLTHYAFTESFVKLEEGKTLLAAHPNVKAWWERIANRPAWSKVQDKEPLAF